MALLVLDGNQSATTLSSVVTDGEHIVAHSVVSLGTTAITNISTAVSGTAVTIPGLARLSNSIASDNTADANLDFIKIGGHQDGQNQVAHIVHVSAGGAMKVDASGSSVTFSQAPVTFGAITGSASILNFPSTQTIAGTVTVGNSTTASAVAVRLIAEDTNPGGAGAGVNVNLYSNDNALLVDALKNGNSVLGYDGLSSYVQVKPAIGSSVTIGSLPAISGTVTANVFNGTISYVSAILDGEGNTFGLDRNFPISGTVTVGNNNFNIKTVIAQDGSANFTASNGTQFRLYTPTGASKTLNNIFGPTPSWIVAFSDSVTWFSDSGTQVAYFHDGTQWVLDDFTTPAGTIALDGSVFITNLSTESFINLSNGFTASQVGSAYVNGSGALRVNLYSSTVTAAAPNGSLTTRFGTPTTANTAFATSAVTNASRKYLLIQNVTTGSNVITVGIGFTPTTTQGIQLTAGAGITFESSYIPTGAVQILSSVTASNFTILEA